MSFTLKRICQTQESSLVKLCIRKLPVIYIAISSSHPSVKNIDMTSVQVYAESI